MYKRRYHQCVANSSGGAASSIVAMAATLWRRNIMAAARNQSKKTLSYHRINMAKWRNQSSVGKRDV